MKQRNVARRDRARLRAVYGGLYALVGGGRVGCCWYCGDDAGELDHVPPLGLMESIDLAERRRAGFCFVAVSSCRECNQRLGNRWLLSLRERVRFVAARLEGDFERRASLWSDEEVAQMSPMFQRLILSRRVLLDVLSARVRFAQLREVGEMPDERFERRGDGYP